MLEFFHIENNFPKPPNFIEFVENDHPTDAELRLQHSQRLEAIGTMTAGIAHDLNNLLTAILGYTCIVKRKITDENMQNNLKEVETASLRATELASQLLAYSRLSHLERQRVDLNSSIADILKMIDCLIPKKIKVTTNCDEAPATVLVNSAQIDQVIMNLCINARDAMPDGGMLVIETKTIELNTRCCRFHRQISPGSYVRIRISDSGIGMDEITQSRIFEPFFTTKDIGKGTGLGLSTVHTIIEQHSGCISVASERGRGTTFTVLLPKII